VLEGFARHDIQTSGASIRLATGGSGPPLLLLHGYPQTHVMWHKIAPKLAAEFTVVAADLRGYGDSSKPEADDDHAAYSKRAMAQDAVDVMAALGFDAFAVAGHDRGARVGYRLALDHPARVTRLAVLDIVPTYSLYANVNRLVATGYWHWFMLIQPYDLPERLIGADPSYFIRTMLARWGSGTLEPFHTQALAEYERCFSDPATIHATCEDYRAGASVDVQHDEADVGKRRIECPVLALYSRRLEALRAEEIWRQWTTDLRVRTLDCGHFLPEEKPDETYMALREFLAAKSP
jgi:haloacetate dehalogenase